MTALGRLFGGEGPPLLQTCRFEGLGGDLYGREAVGDRLKTLPLTHARLDVETARLGVWMDDDHAVVADLFDGRVGRVWMMGETVALSPLAAVDLPVDADLAQARPALRFDAEDHPEIVAEDAERIARALRDDGAWGVRAARPLVLRATSVDGLAVALLRLEGEADDGSPRPVAFNALILIGPDGCERRPDVAGRVQALARPWTPRL